MAGECRWQPRKDQVDPWSRGRKAARGVVTSSSPKHGKRKKVYFLPSERDREISLRVLYTPSDVCRGLGISPLPINLWLNFSQADLGPRSAQE